MIENCRRCGKAVEGGTVFCPDCRSLAGEKKGRRPWFFSLLFSAVLLSLTGLMLWHGGLGNWSFSLGSWWGKPAAVINGEAIPRDEFKARMISVKTAVARQYGKNIFIGERGRALLESLEREVMEGMLEERLVAQEARKLKIDIREDRIEEEVQRISKEIYGTWEKFQTRLREDGISPEELKKHIHNLLLYNALKAAKAPVGADPEISFNAWLIQAKQKAELVIYEKGNRGNNASLLGGNCCVPNGSRAGSGGSPRAGGQLDPQTESEAQRVALEAYQKANPAEKNVAAKVTNYGCHLQVDIQKEGRTVKSYTYQEGKVFEIS